MGKMCHRILETVCFLKQARHRKQCVMQFHSYIVSQTGKSSEAQGTSGLPGWGNGGGHSLIMKLTGTR